MVKQLQAILERWVRRSFKVAHRQSLQSVARKLEAIEHAVQHAFPSGDIRTILAEVEVGYGVDARMQKF